MRNMQIFATITLCLAAGACASEVTEESPTGSSESKITNGKVENGYPYVVRIELDGRGSCTGSFVSSSLLVTAAHCVDSVRTITWNGASTDRSNVFINPNWPTPESGCNRLPQPKFDVALVRFPNGTYEGPEYASLLGRSPREGEPFTLVGYGNNVLQPLDTFCTLPSNPGEDGKCHVKKGKRLQGATYDYSSVLDFDPQAESTGAGCPAACNIGAMKSAMTSQNIDVKEFLVNTCDGNFRDRNYRETGAGTKRSGSNRVLKVHDGMVEFVGGIGGEATGMDSASGAGDSGGPLFIFEGGKPRLAAVTRGGSLAEQNGEFVKRSIYIDLAAPHNFDWIRATVQNNRLQFQGL